MNNDTTLTNYLEERRERHRAGMAEKIAKIIGVDNGAISVSGDDDFLILISVSVPLNEEQGRALDNSVMVMSLVTGANVAWVPCNG